jgi:hypothetical protein
MAPGRIASFNYLEQRTFQALQLSHWLTYFVSCLLFLTPEGKEVVDY